MKNKKKEDNSWRAKELQCFLFFFAAHWHDSCVLYLSSCRFGIPGAVSPGGKKESEGKMNKQWNELTVAERNRIAYDWLQCEGYDDAGNEYDSAQEYYEGKKAGYRAATNTYLTHPYHKGDNNPD